jgi:hypothetical protein
VSVNAYIAGIEQIEAAVGDGAELRRLEHAIEVNAELLDQLRVAPGFLVVVGKITPNGGISISR